jgi:hypothetical protein
MADQSQASPLMFDAARPRGWGHPSPVVPWCVCPGCGDTAFHLMYRRHGYSLTRECRACRKKWTEFAVIPEHALREDGCITYGCECQREARAAGHRLTPERSTA